MTYLNYCIFGEAACRYLHFDSWTITMAVWVFLQGIWVTFLIGSQLWQIMNGMTTNEAINYMRFDYLIHPDDRTAPPYRKRVVNPFNIGPIGNLLDFWSNGAGELKDVSWFSIYETPKYLQEKALRKKGFRSIPTEPKSMEDLV